ncbi:TB2/DP1, HVA22 family [Cooperia oncophora]
MIGFAYPAYASVKAVRTQDTKDDTQWLIYWCVFAAFSIIDFFAGSIMQWFPFYWLFKVAFLMFLFLPQTKGAHYLFYQYLDPLVTAIDESIAKRNNS